MNHHTVCTTLGLALALAVPGFARAFGTVEGFYGVARPPDTSFSSSASAAKADPFRNGLQHAGGDLLLDFGGPLELGAIGDVSWKNESASQSNLGALVGLKLDLGGLRIDALGEAGGHRYGNVASNPEILTASHPSAWLAYVGIRPGIAYQFGTPGLLLGVWGFARWDLASKNVPVTVAGVGGATSDGTIKLGGTQLGAAARLGFTF
jgi:hypothetical protein